ncbi:PAS domain-containing protein [Eubacteriaceae bacterium ES3]|nr:PAS domain-containing protein [Eubacteriaceae bacterium ES3]
MNKKLEVYVSLVDFLAEFMGENTEVVLHDMTDWHHSVVAIRNGYISGRTVGDPITEVSLRILKSQIHLKKDFIWNDPVKLKKKETIRSGTWFIKDDDESLIGMLCINTDDEELIKVRDILNRMVKKNIEAKPEVETEKFSVDAKEMVDKHLTHLMPKWPVKVKMMKKKEKVALVKSLDEMGTFSVKGSIWYLANLLNVSIPTLYRYIAEAKDLEDRE